MQDCFDNLKLIVTKIRNNNVIHNISSFYFCCSFFQLDNFKKKYYLLFSMMSQSMIINLDILVYFPACKWLL